MLANQASGLLGYPFSVLPRQGVAAQTRDFRESHPPVWTKGQVIPYDKGQSEALGERLMDGFELSPLPHVTITDGSTLFWGFKQGDGTVQSLAITDAKGHLQLLGIADGLLLAGVGNEPADAQLHLFVRDPKALDRYLPGVRAWAAADLLGMNQSCTGAQAANCKAAKKAMVPVTAYHLPCPPGKLAACRIRLPNAKGEAPSLNVFWQ